MTQHGYDTRYRRRRGAAAAPPGAPPNSGDILWEIFLRLPPLPSSLVRVSLVCKRWHRLAADPDFLLRFRVHHRKAPLLGLFKENGGWVSFNPVLDPPNRLPCQRFTMRIDYGGAQTYPYHGTLLSCRHGRVLILDPRRCEVLVCEPITGEQRRIAFPPGAGYIHSFMAKGAVLCADGNQGHVHGSCHSSPFKVVLVQTFCRPSVNLLVHVHERGASAWVYSSETGMWSSLILEENQCSSSIDSNRPSTLVGGSLCWWLRSTYDMKILEFDIGRQCLTVTDRLPVYIFDVHCTQIIQGEDGGVGVATLSYSTLQMWDWKVDCGVGVATWILRKTVHLELLPNYPSAKAEIVGYVEDDDAILIKFNCSNNVFIIDLESMHSRKLCESTVTHQYHPFTTFYPPGEFGRCKGLASLASTAPVIEPAKQQAPTIPVRKKARRAR